MNKGNEYKRVSNETGVMTASKVGLIVMLYDGAIAACKIAEVGITQNKLDVKSKNLSKAIDIISSGLNDSLDKTKLNDITASLNSLYLYLIDLLYKANLENSIEKIKETIKILTELRTAWVTLDSKPA